jgi:hypothetical protein
MLHAPSDVLTSLKTVAALFAAEPWPGQRPIRRRSRRNCRSTSGTVSVGVRGRASRVRRWPDRACPSGPASGEGALCEQARGAPCRYCRCFRPRRAPGSAWLRTCRCDAAISTTTAMARRATPLCACGSAPCPRDRRPCRCAYLGSARGASEIHSCDAPRCRMAREPHGAALQLPQHTKTSWREGASVVAGAGFEPATFEHTREVRLESGVNGRPQTCDS